MLYLRLAKLIFCNFFHFLSSSNKLFTQEMSYLSPWLDLYLYLDHEDHVLLVVLDRLLEEGLHLLGELPGVLVTQPTNVFSSRKKIRLSLVSRGEDTDQRLSDINIISSHKKNNVFYRE